MSRMENSAKKDHFTIKLGVKCSKSDYVKVSYDDINEYINNNNNSIEVYNIKDSIKLFLDIDKIYDLKDQKEGEKKRKSIIRDFKDDWYLIDGCRIFDKNGKKIWKLSLHAIHKDIAFVDGEDLRDYIWGELFETHTIIKELYKGGFIDTRVYGSTSRCLRCPNCIMPEAKPQKLIPLKIICNDDKMGIEHYMITYVRDVDVRENIDAEIRLRALRKIGESKRIIEHEINISERVERDMKNLHTNEDDDRVININEIRDMTDIIDLRYLDDRDDWRNIGYALSWVGKKCNKSYDMFKLFMKISKKSKKFDGSGREIFYNARRGGKVFTDKTIYWYANQSDSDRWCEIKKKYTMSEYEEARRIFTSNDTGMCFGDFCSKWRNKRITTDIGQEKFMLDMTKVIGIVNRGSTQYIIKNSKFDYLFRKAICTYDIFSGSAASTLGNVSIILACRPKLANKCFHYALPPIYKKRSFKWMIDNHMNDYMDYRNIIFHPGKLDKKIFNLWNGFEANVLSDDQYDEKKIEAILWHIKHILANGDEKINKYIIQWFANIIQEPEKKNGTCLVFVGEQGCGKNRITDLLGNIIGDRHTESLCGVDSIARKFNSVIGGKLLLVLDESSSLEKNYHKTFDIMKKLITDNTQSIEHKGRDVIKTRCYGNIIMTSNNELCAKIEISDRRYCMMRCSSDKIGNKEYFDKLTKEIDDNKDHFMTYLMKIDRKGYNITIPPITKFKKSIKGMYADNTLKFLAYLYGKEGMIDGFISSRNMFEFYREFERGYSNRLSNMKKNMTTRLLSMKLAKYIRRKRTNKIRGFDFKKRAVLNKIKSYGLSVEDLYEDDDFHEEYDL